MSKSTYDVLVIGSGPGGYVCAIRAAQLGLSVAIVEKDPYRGGTCLNIGCIPSKALLHSSHLFSEMKGSESHGILAGDLQIDVKKLMTRKTKVVDQLRRGVDALLKARKISVMQGIGKIVEPGKVEVSGSEKTETVEAKNVIIATGSVPVELPFMKFDGEHIVSSDHALSFDRVPENLVVIGAGAIGLELGSVWARLGSSVTVVEFLPTVAAGTDDDVSKFLERTFKKQGITIHTQTKVTGAEIKDGKVVLAAEKKGKAVTFEADKVLVSVGRKAYTENLASDSLGLEKDERGRIVVDDHLRTSVSGVWAIGDVVAGPMLAHKAEEDGVAVAEWIAGQHGHIDWDQIPGVIYTHPEVAMMGLSEKQAAEKGIEVKVGKFPLQANGRAIAQDATDGFVKLLADAKTDRVLGAVIVASAASEMIASVCAHMAYGGSAEDIARTIHAHPTISEGIKEAAMATDGWSIHSI